MLNRYSLLTIIAICFTIFTAFGQTKSSDKKQSSNNTLDKAIRLNPVRLFTGTFQLSYEQEINKNFTVSVSGLGTYATRNSIGDPYLKTQELQYKAQDGRSYRYNPQMISGWGIIAQLRHYLIKSQDHPVGFYAAPQLMYRKIWLTGRHYSSVLDYSRAKTGSYTDVTRNLDVFAGGVMLGGQLGIIKNIYTIDFRVGAMMRLSTYGGQSHFTRYKKWKNIDYSGVLPTAGISIGILK